jgi:hypothetical protein
MCCSRRCDHFRRPDGFADCRYQPPRPLCFATMPAAAVVETALDSRQPCYAFWALAELCNELCEHVPHTLSTQAQLQTPVHMQVGSKQQAAVESICPEHHIAAEHSQIVADSIAPRCLDELPRLRPPALKLKRCQHSRPQAVDDSEVTSQNPHDVAMHRMHTYGHACMPMHGEQAAGLSQKK